MTRVYKTKTEMAAGCTVSRSALYRWMLDPDFPAKGRYGWSIVAIKKYARAALQHAADTQTGPDCDLKRAKLERQIKLLDAQIRRADFDHDREAKKYMSLDEHYAELDEHVAIVKGGLEQWCQWVDAELRDAAISERARGIRDRTLTWLEEKCKEGGE